MTSTQNQAQVADVPPTHLERMAKALQRVRELFANLVSGGELSAAKAATVVAESALAASAQVNEDLVDAAETLVTELEAASSSPGG